MTAKGKREPPTQETSLAAKGVWFAAEFFGKAAAALRGGEADTLASEYLAPTGIDDAIERLAADYKGTPDDPRPYFLTGKMDVGLYAQDCTFADPFASFHGRQRFVDNLSNLAGGVIIDSSTRTLDTELLLGDPEAGIPPSYRTKLMVKLQLGLPWKPVLAWPWGVEHVFDLETGLVVKHIESWDVSAAEGVRQLFTMGPPGGLRQGRS